jgi:3-oxoacyl-[acyl-carrier protein] reductase
MLNTIGVDTLLVKADVTDEKQVKKMIEAAINKFGSIDILVNNAGGLLDRSSIESMPLNLWRKMFALNMDSVLYCCQEVIPYMKEKGNGVIINIDTPAADSGGGNGASSYAASKGALVSFSRALANEVGKYGIRVNSIAPPLTETDFYKDNLSEEVKKKWFNKKNPQGTPEDTANLAAFLASDYAKALHGQRIKVTGIREY